MKYMFITVILLTGCVTPPKVRLRSQASSILKGCWYNKADNLKKVCLAESNEFCAAHGLEKNCGVDGVW